jgi:hypothetical protein
VESSGEKSDPYPDAELPWTFYFNGEVMPKWCNHWFGSDLLGVRDQIDEWDNVVDGRRFWILQCRIDHVGKVESEEPDAFRICCLTYLNALLRNPEVVKQAITKSQIPNIDAADLVYSNLCDGLFRMNALVRKDGHAFWNCGYEKDRVELVDRIKRSTAPPPPEPWIPPPHVVDEGWLNRWTLNYLRKSLRELLKTGVTDNVRRKIEAIPEELAKSPAC